MEQRRVMLRMLDAMRSDAFVAVKDLLLGREAALEQVAESGVTDPVQIRAALHDAGELDAPQGDRHTSELIAALDATDQRLVETAGAGPRALLALPARAEPPPPAPSARAST